MAACGSNNMYIYIYICMYVCMYVCICMYVYIYVNISKSARLQPHAVVTHIKVHLQFGYLDAQGYHAFLHSSAACSLISLCVQLVWFAYPAAKEPPMQWMHANLKQLAEYLEEEVARGRFSPVLNMPLR